MSVATTHITLTKISTYYASGAGPGNIHQPDGTGEINNYSKDHASFYVGHLWDDVTDKKRHGLLVYFSQGRPL